MIVCGCGAATGRIDPRHGAGHRLAHGDLPREERVLVPGLGPGLIGHVGLAAGRQGRQGEEGEGHGAPHRGIRRISRGRPASAGRRREPPLDPVRVEPVAARLRGQEEPVLRGPQEARDVEGRVVQAGQAVEHQEREVDRHAARHHREGDARHHEGGPGQTRPSADQEHVVVGRGVDAHREEADAAEQRAGQGVGQDRAPLQSQGAAGCGASAPGRARRDGPDPG